MKATGAYNPVTQEATGSYAVDRTDYQEQRKSTAMGFGMILVIIAAIGFTIWYLWQKFVNSIPNPAGDVVNYVTNTYNTATKTIVDAANSVGEKDPTKAIDVNGNPYPVKTLTRADYEAMLQGLGLLKIPVQAGTIITPPVILDAATAAGAQAANTVNTLGLNNAYVDLGLPQKALVTFGEGIGMIFGVDLIQLGYDMRPKV